MNCVTFARHSLTTLILNNRRYLNYLLKFLIILSYDESLEKFLALLKPVIRILNFRELYQTGFDRGRELKPVLFDP